MEIVKCDCPNCGGIAIVDEFDYHQHYDIKGNPDPFCYAKCQECGRYFRHRKSDGEIREDLDKPKTK